MGVMKRLATGAGGPRIRTGRYGKAFDGFHVDFSMFVDRKGVMERIEGKRLKVLGRTGAFGMQTMRRSIRPAPKKRQRAQITLQDDQGRTVFIDPQGRVRAANGRFLPKAYAAKIKAKAQQQKIKPQRFGVGQPPRRGPSDLLRKRIFFGVEAETETVVIGPEMFSSQPTMYGAVSVPQLLDQGGIEMMRSKLGKVYQAHFEPRPFVAPALPPTQKRMAELIESTPL